LLVWLARRKTFDGQILIAYSVVYAVGRFILEYFRGDVDRGFVFGGLFSTSQFIAIIVFALALAALPSRRRAGVGLPVRVPQSAGSRRR
jgi:phosphatidylglycerol:prolipoprotein diacylglycerol transferase